MKSGVYPQPAYKDKIDRIGNHHIEDDSFMAWYVMKAFFPERLV